jgi:hypothetical protein
MINSENKIANAPGGPGAPASASSSAAPPATDAPPKTAEQLQKELDAAHAELAVFRSAKAAASDEEVLVAAKMAVGLTRPQAAAVIRRQRAFDESDFGKAQSARHRAKHGLSAPV